MEIAAGTLYLVGTPIGNLEDMTFRAVRVLQGVDCIAAEDTRHTGNLLKHFAITTPQISFHSHNCQTRIPLILERLSQGAVALVTDAGMPGISDPGWELVEACVAAELTVVPIPGATAAITALVASGLPTDRFVFEGFLPTDHQSRQQRLQALIQEPRTIVLYEAPHRILRTLEEFESLFGLDRSIVVARELTKRFETFWRGTLADARPYFTQHPPRGEFTLVLQGAKVSELIWSETQIRDELHQLLSQGKSRSEASRLLAETTKIPKRELYRISLQLDQESAVYTKQ